MIAGVDNKWVGMPKNQTKNKRQQVSGEDIDEVAFEVDARVGELEALVRESGMKTVLLEESIADHTVSLMAAKQELIEVKKQLAMAT